MTVSEIILKQTGIIVLKIQGGFHVVQLDHRLGITFPIS